MLHLVIIIHNSRQVHDFMVKEQLLLVNKASDPVVVPLMSVVIDVDAVSDEAAAMRHLEASNPAIMVVLGGDMRAPRAFATYKVSLLYRGPWI